jgi:hypothetical protein
MMVKTLTMAAALIVSSAGIALAQKVEKGATLFKQCAACHKIGPDAKNGIGPELNALDGRHSGSTAIPMPIRILGSCGMSRLLRIISRIRERRSPAQKWYSLGSRTNKRPRTCGHTSSSSMPRAASRSKLFRPVFGQTILAPAMSSRPHSTIPITEKPGHLEIWNS